jgi:hypothetical protein
MRLDSIASRPGEDSLISFENLLTGFARPDA